MIYNKEKSLCWDNIYFYEVFHYLLATMVEWGNSSLVLHCQTLNLFQENKVMFKIKNCGPLVVTDTQV